MPDRKYKMVHQCWNCGIKKETLLVKENMENKVYGNIRPFFSVPKLLCSVCFSYVDTSIEEIN